MSLALLHTNDFHGKLDAEKAARIRELKSSRPNSVYFDTGDCIKTGNLGVPLKPERAWELLHLAGCDAGVPGNRESHILAPAFKAKIEGACHPLLCANLRTKSGEHPLPEHLCMVVGDIKVSLFGVMVPMVTERMATRSASAYIWEPPLVAARRKVEVLRPQADVLIALTHIGLKQDQALAEECPGIDVILGGHSHTVLQQPLKIGQCFICQGGSHGRFVGVYEWKGSGTLEGSLLPL